jgi:quercetin 2,3-dioxygenase
MIEHRPFDELPSEDVSWLKARRHLSLAAREGARQSNWGCMRAWDDEEIAPNAGFALQTHANVEIVTYVREGTLTHRDSLGNEGQIEAGSVQVVSAGVGIRHALYNLESAPARIFQIWLEPTALGGSPAWGVQPCPIAECSGRFVALASGIEGDQDALPIRAHARVLKAKLKVGETIEYDFCEPRLAYLVASSGTVEVNGVRIRERDGAAIKGAPVVKLVAIDDAEVLMVDVLSGAATRHFRRRLGGRLQTMSVPSRPEDRRKAARLERGEDGQRRTRLQTVLKCQGQ